MDNKLGQHSLADSNKSIKKLLAERKKLSARDFKPGNLLFFSYNAQDKNETFDKNPMVLVLKVNKTHTLAINFHWLPFKFRMDLIKIILESNKMNIKYNKPLQFSFEQLKPYLRKPQYLLCTRVYINKRISGTGVVLPPERLIEAAKLKTESFTNGRLSAEQMFALAIKKRKK